ncbi:MAG: TIGR00282 family metallophosphoesterase [Candidatus Melainabacteria bacterium]|nr:TIGR00282 family metallophosphoesterase [Candidatus Melainabacteria bacterium]
MTPLTDKKMLQLLFFGDIVGRVGRKAVETYLSSRLPEPVDIVIANVENASHGFGLTEKHYYELNRMGIHIMTGGNHSLDRKETHQFIESAPYLLRPANFFTGTPGCGAKVYDIAGFKIAVLNLIGQVFMGNYNSPWEYLDEWVPQLLNETPIVFVDLHAETTAEKICMARYAATLGVSAMVGTHTHVQTADERILNHRMGYITDVGFNGGYDSVIGMDPTSSLNKMRSHSPTRLEVSECQTVQVNAVRFEIEAATGVCIQVQRVMDVFSLANTDLSTSIGR